MEKTEAAPVTVKAACTKCGDVQTIRVAREWWQSDTFRCCGLMASFWLDDSGAVKFDGYARPA